MEYVKFKCYSGDITKPKNCNFPQTIEFDAWGNYDLLNEFFYNHDPALVCSREEYFEDVDRDAWIDYVIMENGMLIARAAIYKNSKDSWEVAGVSTIPTYRRKGYGEAVVRYCTERILESNKIATLTTKKTNLAMIATAKKVGFNIDN